jgi:hypothetical protein
MLRLRDQPKHQRDFPTYRRSGSMFNQDKGVFVAHLRFLLELCSVRIGVKAPAKGVPAQGPSNRVVRCDGRETSVTIVPPSTPQRAYDGRADWDGVQLRFNNGGC